MSVEEEVELRDLVAQTLELNGCLPKIRAQLRANLFLSLDEDAKISKQQHMLNNKVKTHLEGSEGQLMFCLVREFLEYFDLDFTISVYEPESCMGNLYKYEGRQKIIEDLGLKSSEENFSGPVLLQLIKIAQTKSRTLKINLTNVNGDKSDEQKTTNGSSSISSVDNEINGHVLSEIENYENNKKTVEQEYNQNTNPVKKNLATNHIKDNMELEPALQEPPLNSTFTKKEVENDDTFNGTSSIEEETVNGTDSCLDMVQKSTEEKSASTSHDTSPETKSKSEDKIKTSQKCDKLKSKLELSPLQLNKPRGSEILPSLYSKDFKEKNNKDLDLDFDIKDDYEEDFMSGSEVEFSLSKVDCPKPLLEELQHYERSASNENTSNSQSSIASKIKNLSSVTNQKINKKSNSAIKTTNNSTETDNIETSLSVDIEVANNSSFTNSEVN